MKAKDLNSFITVRLREEDKARLSDHADQLGFYLSDWARDVLFEALPDSNKPDPAQTENDALRHENERLGRKIEAQQETLLLILREAMHARQLAAAWTEIFEDTTQGERTKALAAQKTERAFADVQARLKAIHGE